jgi:hypothetical protein
MPSKKWYALANTLDLHSEDLIDDAKLALIIEKNASSTGAERCCHFVSRVARPDGSCLDGSRYSSC